MLSKTLCLNKVLFIDSGDWEMDIFGQGQGVAPIQLLQ